MVRDEVLDVFNEFTRDETHTVVLSSHIVSDLEKICDYIAFLHKGKLILFDYFTYRESLHFGLSFGQKEDDIF